MDECVEDPAGCLPEAPDVDRCLDAPQSCLPEAAVGEESPGKDPDHGDDEDEESVAPVKGRDPKGRSRSGSGGAGREPDPALGKTSSTDAALRERPAAHVTVPPDGLLDRIRRGLTDAAQRFVFPLAVAALVAAFVLVQDRIDRRDPKLAAAPIDSRDDVVGFR